MIKSFVAKLPIAQNAAKSWLPYFELKYLRGIQSHIYTTTVKKEYNPTDVKSDY